MREKVTITWIEWKTEAGLGRHEYWQSLPRRWRVDALEAWQSGVDPTEYRLGDRRAA